MGLDIYCRWGETNEDGDYDWYKESSKHFVDYEDQITGFSSRPHAGYLRESWSSLRWVTDVAEKYNAPSPYSFFEEWSGFNGDVYDCNNGGLDRLVKFRDESIRPWLRANKYLGDVSEDDRKEFNHFRERLEDVWSFINFIELHKNEENLVVIFG